MVKLVSICDTFCAIIVMLRRFRRFRNIITFVFLLILVVLYLVHLNNQRKWRKQKVDSFCSSYHYNKDISGSLVLKSSFKESVFNELPKWSSVDNLFIYTARSRNKYVELLAIVPNKPMPFVENLYCSDNLDGMSRSVKIQKLLDAHQFAYGVAYLFCPTNRTHQVENVTIFHPEKRGQVTIPIYNIVERHNRSVVCVRPLFGPFNDSKSLIEFIAFYYANDITDFVFFNLDITPIIKDLLRQLKNVKINVYEWNLNWSAIQNTLAGAQNAAIRFCLDHFPDSIVVHVDLDEYMKPVVTNNLNQFLIQKKIDAQHTAAVIVRSIMFCEEYNTNLSNGSSIRAMVDVRRQYNSWHWNKKSKVVYLRPDKIIDASIHYVWSTAINYKIEEIGDDELIVYHYRSCCGNHKQYMFSFDIFNRELDLGVFHPLEDSTVIDQTMLTFRGKMLKFLHFNVENYD